VAIVDGSGNHITSFGAAVQYTKGDVDASITGTAILLEEGGSTLKPVPGSTADGLLVNLGANNDVTVTNTATVSTGLTQPLTDTQLRASPVPVSVGASSTVFQGMAATFRTPGRAGTAGQKIMAIHNASGSSVTLKVTHIDVDLYMTAAKAVTVLPPIIRIWKFTDLPTNGTVLTKTKIRGTGASSSSCVVFGDASADGTGSATTLTVTLPAGTFIAQRVTPRIITAVGEVSVPNLEFKFDTPIELGPEEGLCVFLNYTAATSNPTTDMWFASVEWEEV
jgi:hypothetical protein